MRWLAEVTVLGAVLNLLAFGFISSLLGGEPGSGKIENAHYFLTNHKQRIEVSAATYYYSMWHARSLFLTQPLGGLALLWLWLRNRRSG